MNVTATSMRGGLMNATASSMPDLMNASGGSFLSNWTSGGATKHQALQYSLGDREKGGPHEQSASAPFRMRTTRGTEILHSFLMEPLANYKTLEHVKPHWPTNYRRYHLNDGIRVGCQDTIVVSARDKVDKTGKGVHRSSTGTVTYSATHRMKVELDVEVLGGILKEGVPGGGPCWTPKKLERIFRERTGRQGTWAHYEVPFVQFLQLFPKTFQLLGHSNEYIRLRHKNMHGILDHGEEVIIRLAKARELGYVERGCQVKNSYRCESDVVLPDLQRNRVKSMYTPYDTKTDNEAEPGPGGLKL